MSETKTRTRRTPAELIAEIDSKISFHEERIKLLQAKKEKLLTPKKRPKSTKTLIKQIVGQAAEQGIDPKEIAEKLGIKLED